MVVRRRQLSVGGLLLAVGSWAALCGCRGVDAFLPGLGPARYKDDETIPLFINELTSTKTQIPLDYYSVGFCQEHKVERESLGEILEGDRVETSPYQLAVNVNVDCAVACARTLSKPEKYMLASTIKDQYRVHMTVDDLPAALQIKEGVEPSLTVASAMGPEQSSFDSQDDSFFVRGFPLGFSGSDNEHYLNNHLRVTLGVHPLDNTYTEFNIVGFMVEPFSVEHEFPEPYQPGTPISTCPQPGSIGMGNGMYKLMDVFHEGQVLFTYDVYWQETDMPWTHRWDIYVNSGKNQNSNIHWFGIINSSVIVLFLTVLVAMITIRALRKDIQHYNAESIEDAKEESGWKLVHGDVLRPPSSYPMLFAVCVGTGVQLCCTSFLVVFFGMIGLISPAQRGNTITAIILLFVLMGGFSGYNAARIHRRFRGTSWIKTTLATAGMFPGVSFAVFFVLNSALMVKKSTGVVPFSALCILLFLWLLVQTPLVFLGSYYGFRKDPPEQVVRTNQIPRMIPQMQWYVDPMVAVPFAGVLPFGAVFVELYFVMSILWQEELIFIFQFLMIVMFILTITCVEIAIVMCYFQLCAEDYRWWWRSMLWPGSCAFWMFAYSIWYYSMELEMVGFVPGMLFFGYTGVLMTSFFLMTGTVGYFSCQWFINKIYSSIKVD